MLKLHDAGVANRVPETWTIEALVNRSILTAKSKYESRLLVFVRERKQNVSRNVIVYHEQMNQRRYCNNQGGQFILLYGFSVHRCKTYVTMNDNCVPHAIGVHI